MRYPVAIEPGDEHHAFGVVVPDLPGCFSAGDTLDEAMANTVEAIFLMLEGYLDEKEAFPASATLAEHHKNPQFNGWIWALVDVDLTQLDNKAERVNITLPKRVLRVIDEGAKRAGESRSAFLARAGLETARGGQ